MSVGNGQIRPVRPVTDDPSLGGGFVPRVQPQNLPPQIQARMDANKIQVTEVPEPSIPQIQPVQRPVTGHVCTLNSIPSGFKGYPGIDHIEIRSFTLRELKYLSSGLTDEQVINAFRPAILNINVDDLSFYDFLYISSHINIVTSDDQNWTMEINCQSCGKPFTYNTAKDGFFQFEELQIPDLPINVTFSGVELQFDLPRVKDSKIAKTLKKRFPKSSDELIGFSAQCRNLPPEQTLNILENLTDPEDIALVNEIQKKLYHGSLPLKAICPECSYEGEYRVGQGVSTIKPFRDNGKSLDDRISYGARN